MMISQSKAADKMQQEQKNSHHLFKLTGKPFGGEKCILNVLPPKNNKDTYEALHIMSLFYYFILVAFTDVPVNRSLQKVKCVFIGGSIFWSEVLLTINWKEDRCPPPRMGGMRKKQWNIAHCHCHQILKKLQSFLHLCARLVVKQSLFVQWLCENQFKNQDLHIENQ